jgi:5-(carboxyamino)imidazole ribonucleotide synthase
MNDRIFSGATTLGILGGGQLGRMMIREALDMDIRIWVLDPSLDCPCAPYAHATVHGDFADYHTVKAFGNDVDVITVEIEHVNTRALKELRDAGKQVHPSPEVLDLIRDKGRQKQFYVDNNIPTSAFRLVEGKSAIDAFPAVQKARTGGYDGKGVQVLRTAADMERAFDVPSVLEELVDIDKEIAVLVARGTDGEVRTYPVVEMVFDPVANLVDNLVAPARIAVEQAEQARQLAVDITRKLDYVGIMAVEMFITRAGEILVNEMAPRPHNSGHHTIEACYTSQFEQHLRAILGLPLGSTQQVHAASMLNVLGEAGHSGPAVYPGALSLLAEEGVFLHLYGKANTKPFRKMGHITVLATTADEALQKALRLKGVMRAEATP